MLVLECLAWDLNRALQDRRFRNRELSELLARLPEMIVQATTDVRRNTFALYMFWDLVLVGSEGTLGRDGHRATVRPSVVEALLRLRFSDRPVVRRSAEHGLFHLARCLDIPMGDLNHP